MSIKTSRASGVADVKIDRERCTKCGLCVRVCKGGPLYLLEGEIAVDQSRGFGCIACGQCVAVCPCECIQVDGRDMSPGDVLELPAKEQRAGHDTLRALMLARRSVRDYDDRPVDRAILEQIVEAATTAPMGIPPTDVAALVLDTKEKVKPFRNDLLR
ncbi:MAG: nitroreductase family protein [Candidatus Hydrogenedentes bacterium]|nr:nitroreductase family protein [Candidatus Hydrogenedentota bacterium]